MEKTKFTFASPSSWISAIAFALIFGLTGIQQLSAQLTLQVSDGSGGTPPDTLNFTPPEGLCGVSFQWSALVFDFAGAATLTATITNNLAQAGALVPTAQVLTTDNNQVYGIYVLAAVGTNTLTLTATGPSGTTQQVFTIFVNDVRAPLIFTPGNMTLQIPSCPDGVGLVPVNYTYAVIDDCDLNPIAFPAVVVTGPASGSLVGVGVHTVTIIATDDAGNSATSSFNITVTQTASPAPIVDVSGNGQFYVPACEDDVFVVFSGNVIDCDIDAGNPVVAADITITGAALTVTYVDNNNGFAYFEATSPNNLAPGTYLVLVTYGGVTVDHLVTVVQDANRAPDIFMPGNLTYLLPACVNQLNARWAVTITDDCDATITGATFQLNGAPITPVTANTAAGYFEFLTLLTPAANGAVITASYTDGGGLTTTVNATLQVVDQPDTWAPIIIYPSQDINVALDPCAAGPAIIFFEVTATDNCDGDVTPIVTITPAAAGAIVFPSIGGDTYGVAAFPGTYQILIEASDAAGNTRFEDFFIVVTQAPAPPTNLACNTNINVTVDANCQRLITADMVLEGSFGCAKESDFAVNIVNDDNPANGNILDGCGQFVYDVKYIGPTITGPGQGNLQVTTVNTAGFNGALAPANWQVTLPAAQFGGSATFTANTLTLVSPNGQSCPGGQNVTASFPALFDGTMSFDWVWNNVDPNFDFFITQITSGGTTTTLVNTGVANNQGSISLDVAAGDILILTARSVDCIFGSGTAVISNIRYDYQAVVNGDPIWPFFNWQPCWGYITGEDKTAPILTCPPNTDEACVNVTLQAITGALTGTDPQINTANYSCFQQFFAPTSGLRRYDLNYFQVDREDYYTFYIVAEGGWAPDVAMYQGSFTPGNPCENIIGYSDFGVQITPPTLILPGGNSSTAPFLAMTLPLRPFEDYYFFVTSRLANITGDYTVYMVAQDGGRIGRWTTTTTVNPLTWVETTTTAFTPFAGEFLGQVCFDLVCDDLDFLLNNPASLAAVGQPTATDNCGTPTVTFTDTAVTPGDCAPTTLTRRFTATDSKGNSSVCTQVITLRKLTLGDVFLPPFTVPIECDEDFISLPANPFGQSNPSPESAGYPFIVSAQGIILLNDSYCNLGATYEDSPRVTICESAYKVVRTWTILDWCNPFSAGANLLVWKQTIKVGDFTPPVVTCPTQTVWSTSPFACTGAFTVPMPVVTDNCSGWTVHTEIVTEVIVDLFNQYGLPAGTRTDTVVVRTIAANAPTRNVSGIPAGNHYFRYTVTDNCGNATVKYCPFSIRDLIEPVAVCTDQLNVSIGGGDFARVMATSIDAGSWDNCEVDRIEVRRNKFNPITYTCGSTFSAWAPYVDFFCCDIGVEITIELRVTDKAGNQNICWMVVTPEDKVRPFCYAPPATNIDCDDLPYDFDGTNLSQLQALFGTPTAEDNCEAVAEELPSIVDLHCRFGRITRRFRAVDIHGNVSTNFCQQIITVNEVHNYEIKFPKDAEANCGDADADVVEYTEIACDLLAVSSTDEFFSASGDECYKIFRTWRVINWCQYDGQSGPFVVGRDEDCDNNPGDECVWVLHRPNGKTYIDRDNDELNNVPLSFQNPCWGITGFWRKVDYDGGFFQYTQHIKVYDDKRPEITGLGPDEFCSYDNVNCDGLVAYQFQIDENCTPDDLTIKIFLDAFNQGTLTQLSNAAVLTGTYPDYTITGRFPIGCHAFEVHVLDGCGNSNAEKLAFCVVDCKAPAPTCINGLAIELMPIDTNGDGTPDDCGMETWASDFIVSPMGDCTGPVKYSINRVGETPDPNASGLVLTGADVGTLVVQIWAWDGAGNGDFCETYILVQDNMSVCPGQGLLSVSGAVSTEANNGVEDVQVSLSGQGAASMMTNAAGTYAFTGVQAGYDYTVTPQRDGDYLNGVSTFDLVLISKHILGVESLNSPYKMIAADVNNSRSITTLDLIQLRKLILSIDTQFGNNTSWRFVSRSYVFPNPANPWFEDFPEVININNLPASVLNANFVAVKIGDVNLDAVTNSFMAVEERDIVGAFTFEVADEAVKAGGEYTVTFAAGTADVDGYQGTLAFDNAVLELVDLIKGAAAEENFGLTRINEGAIATSWNGQVEAGQAMFSLVFRAKADGQMSELLGVSSRMVKAEAYNQAGQYMDLAINFGTSVAAAGFELYQNVPNPFKGETMIGFNLPADDKVTIKISDITGKALKLIRMDGAKGYNQLSVNSKELAATGVLTYTVETSEFTATKKMVIVE